MKLFVWDFHGTLEKDNDLAVLEISNKILESRGYKERFSEAQCRQLSGTRWFKYFEYLLPSEPPIKHMGLQEDCLSYSNSHSEIIIKHIKPTDHAKEVLALIGQKHNQILVSNTQPSTLKIFLEAVGLSRFFPKGKAFATDSRINHKTKSDILKGFLSVHTYDEIITIGDSPDDVEMGKVVGAKTFLYTHPGQPFRDCNPHFRINDLREVLRTV